MPAGVSPQGRKRCLLTAISWTRGYSNSQNTCCIARTPFWEDSASAWHVTMQAHSWRPAHYQHGMVRQCHSKGQPSHRHFRHRWCAQFGASLRLTAQVPQHDCARSGMRILHCLHCLASAAICIGLQCASCLAHPGEAHPSSGAQRTLQKIASAAPQRTSGPLDRSFVPRHVPQVAQRRSGSSARRPTPCPPSRLTAPSRRAPHSMRMTARLGSCCTRCAQ